MENAEEVAQHPAEDGYALRAQSWEHLINNKDFKLLARGSIFSYSQGKVLLE